MNELMNQKTTEIATEAPMDFMAGATGFEGIDRDCIQTPFLKLAQSATDETKKQNSLYIPGLEPGMYFCPSTRKVYGSKMNIVLTHFDRMYVIYEGVGKDSKFKGSITPAEYDRDIAPFAVREKSYTVLNGLRYVDTRNMLVVPYDSPYDGPMMLSFSSSGITPSKKLITQAMNVRAVKDGIPVAAPMWSSVWSIESEYFTDPKGDYFQLARIERMGWVNAKLAPKVKELFDDMQGIHIAPASEGEAHATVRQDHVQQNEARTANVEDMAQQSAGDAGTEYNQNEIF